MTANTNKVEYASERMSERHEAILATAREMLSEGDGTIRMRDLAKRSGVALGTLYNRFGGKESLAGEAVVEVLRDRLVSWEDTHGQAPIDRMLSRIKSSVDEILRRPAFATKMVHIYFSAPKGDHIAQLLHTVPLAELKKGVAALSAEGLLSTKIDPDGLAEELLVSEYAVIARWASGDIEDDDLLPRLESMLRTHLAGAMQA